MRRALVLLLCACGAGPDDLFVIGGRTTSMLGEGLDGVPVTALRQQGGGCSRGKVLRGVDSADGGLFSFDFIRVEVQSLSGETSTCVRLQADFESGAAAWTDMYFFPNRLTLPDFTDWRGGLAIEDGGVPRFTPVLPAETALNDCRGNFPPREEVLHGLVARLDGGIAWETTDRTVRYELDDAGSTVKQIYEPVPLLLRPEALEDFTLDVTLEAKRYGCFEVSGGGSLGMPGPFVTHTHWASPGTVRVQGRMLPVSRAARCDDFPDPCSLTDGRPGAVILPRPMNNFRIRLARSARIRAILIRDALTDSPGPTVDEVSIRVGTDSLTETIVASPRHLDEIEFVGDGIPLERHWLYIPLSREVGLGSTVELEFSRVFFRLGEISLFE